MNHKLYSQTPKSKISKLTNTRVLKFGCGEGSEENVKGNKEIKHTSKAQTNIKTKCNADDSYPMQNNPKRRYKQKQKKREGSIKHISTVRTLTYQKSRWQSYKMNECKKQNIVGPKGRMKTVWRKSPNLGKQRLMQCKAKCHSHEGKQQQGKRPRRPKKRNKYWRKIHIEAWNVIQLKPREDEAKHRRLKGLLMPYVLKGKGIKCKGKSDDKDKQGQKTKQYNGKRKKRRKSARS